MLILGLLLGFAGGGGSGFVLALLISTFQIPIHTALGTSTASMFFTVLSGTFSHIREGNIIIKTGLIVGIFGAAGSYSGTFVAGWLPSNILIWISASMLFLSLFLVWLRTSIVQNDQAFVKRESNRNFWIKAPCLGLVTGFLSGCFGIGSTPLIQLGLLMFFYIPLRQAAATTMMILLPISLFGAVGFYQAGFVDVFLLFQIVAGTMTGSYIGSKFTKRAPSFVLRYVIIVLPILGGILLLN